MIKKTLFALTALAATVSPASAGEELSISGGVDVVSAYIFRGFQLADLAIQPYVELGAGGFYAGIWSSTPLEDRDLFDNEVDIYAGYGFDISESLAGDVGFTRYIYTDSDGEADTTEYYFGISHDSDLAPSLYLYYDVDLEATTLEGSIGKSWDVGEDTSFDLGGTLGFIDADGDDFTYLIASAGFSKPIAENADAWIGLSYGFNSEDGTFGETLIDEDDQGLWLGIGISASN